MMKITIKENVKSAQPSLELKDIKPGSIIEFDISDSPVGLVVSTVSGKNDIVLLAHLFSNGHFEDWFQLAAGWKKQPIKRILGRLTEIIVGPI